jgi:glycosyltransferase involved in cell wall biosynthesis
VGDPLFSVIIPAYRRVDFLESALRSVQAQTFGDYETIVIDDGSDPPLRDQLPPELLRVIRYTHKPNGGGASARNVGIEQARGRLLAFLDHDDQWAPNKLAAHAEAMRDPGVVLSYARVERYRGGQLMDVRPEKGPSGRIVDAIIEDSIVRGYSSVVIRRDALIEAGMLDESYRVADDYEILFRLAELGRFQFVPEILSRANLHLENTTRDRLRLHLERARMFEGVIGSASGRRARRLRYKTGYHLRKAGDEYRRLGDRRSAGEHYRRGIAVYPLSGTTYLRFLWNLALSRRLPASSESD